MLMVEDGLAVDRICEEELAYWNHTKIILNSWFVRKSFTRLHKIEAVFIKKDWQIWFRQSFAFDRISLSLKK